jgi:hypothetical protein
MTAEPWRAPCPLQYRDSFPGGTSWPLTTPRQDATSLRPRKLTSQCSRSWSAMGTRSGLLHRSVQHRYSITSSAVISKPGGTVKPSAFAVLRFDDGFELRRRLHRKISGLCATQDAVNIRRRLSIQSDEVSPVAHETARCDENADRVNCGQAMPGCQCDNEITMDHGRGIRRQHQAANHSVLTEIPPACCNTRRASPANGWRCSKKLDQISRALPLSPIQERRRSITSCGQPKRWLHRSR